MPQKNKAVRIAVDAMGGDYAPAGIVEGAISAAQESGVEIILVGPLETIEAELVKHNTSHLPIQTVGADGFIKEGEHPALALRRKPNASVFVATRLVKNGEADAIVSAGSTGAVVASALTILGTLEGIERPVVGGPIIGLSPNTIIMDAGGNIDCKPHHLLNFAIVGCVYARRFLNIPNPTVALLSTGAEEGKGNKLVQESYQLLKQSGLNFIGNVEGNGILGGQANVVVCDGFVGNILIKFCESIGSTIGRWLKDNLKGQMTPSDIESLCANLWALTNITDTTGGGPLWGVNGVAVIAHGHSRAPQIAGAISQAKKAVNSDLVGALSSELAKIKMRADP